jgi:hypothetical protein
VHLCQCHDVLIVCVFLPALLGSGPELVTRACGDVRDAIGRPVEAGQLAAVDPACRCIALHLYDGQLKVHGEKWEGRVCVCVLTEGVLGYMHAH